MKITIVVAALLAFITADQVNAMQIYKHQESKHAVAKKAEIASESSDDKKSSSSSSSSSDGDKKPAAKAKLQTKKSSKAKVAAKDSSSSSSSSDANVQLEDEEVDHSGEFFAAGDIGHGTLDKTYERVNPVKFEDDMFMKSMVMTYAFETKNKAGDPAGAFRMNEATTRAAAMEVLATHKGMAGPALDAYMKEYFPRTWLHFDVNHAGMIGVEDMPQFMRFLASDQTLNL